MKKLIAFIILSLFSLTSNACVYLAKEPDEYYTEADVVFIARRVESQMMVWTDLRQDPITGSTTHMFAGSPLMHAMEVTEVFKDEPNPRAPLKIGGIVFVLQQGGSCAAPIHGDLEFLIFGEKIVDDTFKTSLSRGSESVEVREDMIPVLRRLSDSAHVD